MECRNLWNKVCGVLFISDDVHAEGEIILVKIFFFYESESFIHLMKGGVGTLKESSH